MNISGQGYYASVATSYNPTTGTVSVNPANYGAVTGNVTNVQQGGATFTYGANIPVQFGLGNAFSGQLAAAKNIPAIATLTALGQTQTTNIYENYSAATGFSLRGQSVICDN